MKRLLGRAVWLDDLLVLRTLTTIPPDDLHDGQLHR